VTCGCVATGQGVAAARDDPWSSTLVAWRTTSSRFTPPAVNVTTPVRVAPLAFAVALTPTDAPDAPNGVLTESHDAWDAADHDPLLAVGVTVVDPPAAGADHASDDSDSVAPPLGAALCCTLNVSCRAPALKTTENDRAYVTVLPGTCSVTVWPELPVMGDTVTPVGAETVHDEAFVVTVSVLAPPPAGACHPVSDKTSVVPDGA
jgi:hypothetical protein